MHDCRCTGGIIQRYMGKISGPLLDRIDLHMKVSRTIADLGGSEQIQAKHIA